MQTTLFAMGALSGTEKVEPIGSGDIIVTHAGARHVVTGVDDNIHGAVYLTVKLDTGNDAIVLEREVAYRSRG